MHSFPNPQKYPTKLHKGPDYQGLRSSSSAKYVVQRTRTKFAERAFSVAGPSVWNSLPADLRLEPDTAVFKRKLESYLVRSVFTQ